MSEFQEGGITRRKVVKGVVIAGLGLALASGIDSLRDLVETLSNSGRSKSGDKLWGQPIERRPPEVLITAPVEGDNRVPVRSSPSLSESDLLGYAQTGVTIPDAVEVYGPVYPSNAGGYTRDGVRYGSWYKVKLPVEDKDGRRVMEGYIASNYLKEPEREPR